MLNPTCSLCGDPVIVFQDCFKHFDIKKQTEVQINNYFCERHYKELLKLRAKSEAKKSKAKSTKS